MFSEQKNFSIQLLTEQPCHQKLIERQNFLHQNVEKPNKYGVQIFLES